MGLLTNFWDPLHEENPNSSFEKEQENQETKSHYLPIKSSKLRKSNQLLQLEQKYSATKIDRKNIEKIHENDQSEKHQNDAAPSATPSATPSASPSSPGPAEDYERYSAGTQESANHDETSESDQDTEEEEDDSQSDSESDSGDIIKRLEMQQKEEKAILKSLHSASSNDRLKGIQVKKQLEMWDWLLDCRIRTQKGVEGANVFPQPQFGYQDLVGNDEIVMQQVSLLGQELIGVFEGLCSLEKVQKRSCSH